MRSIRIIAAHLVLLASATLALAVQAETPFEETVQYALEHLPSGVTTAAQVEGTRLTVRPLRTWKSVSGHYCRQYETVVAKPGTDLDRGESIRCRDGEGVWKPVRQN